MSSIPGRSGGTSRNEPRSHPAENFEPPKNDAELHERLTRTWKSPPGALGFFTAVNQRVVGVRFLVTAFVFLMVAGLQAVVIRTQLAQPALDVVSADYYNSLFTMHGTTMLFLFAVPAVEALIIYVMPLMIGVRDMAFPRLNAFGYWTYLLAGVSLYLGFFLGQRPDGGWYAYPPLTTDYIQGRGMDWWATSITFLEISALVAAVEIIATIFKMRAPGMSFARMPIFVWASLVTAFVILFAMPAVMLASITIALDRLINTRFYEVLMGGSPVLYQHIFWYFGHPEVYLIFIPMLGVLGTVVSTFARRPLVAYPLVVASFILIGILSFGLWVHHMFTTGLPVLGANFFSATSMLVAIPSGIQVFSFIATLWMGRIWLTTSLWFAIGYVFIFMLGGVTGVMVASVPFNWQIHDTYFVVAHFHYVIIGGVLFPFFAALYYWFPKITGRMLSERLGMWNFWLMFIGFNIAFFPQHILGFMGMPRRVYTYPEGLGWGDLNLLSTAGAYVLTLGIAVFLWNVAASLRGGVRAGDNPWNAPTLEWATTSPPQQYNFLRLPVVRSRYPLWDTPGEPDPPGRERAAETGELTRDQINPDVRENWTTSLMDAHPQTILHLPYPSIWPFYLAISVAVIFIGAMFTLWAVPVGAVMAYASLIGWHWPFRKGGEEGSRLRDRGERP